ncbi:MAG: cytochrome-c peroxidase [Calditrichia bacterium]
MFRNYLSIPFILALLSVLLSCGNDQSPVMQDEEELLSTPILPANIDNYASPELPAHIRVAEIQITDNLPANNPITDAGATLGRVLFYDRALSQNHTISCASCHVQENGFSDPRQFSVGFNGGETGRNSMGLSNSRFYSNGHFFWDQRAQTLEDQTLAPIQDAVEMGLTLSEMETRLSNLDYYPPLFRNAFGDETINSTRVAAALSQFIRSMISCEAPYDVGRATVNSPMDNFPNFTQQENLGKQIFFSQQANCSSCHSTDLFTTREPFNIGLDRNGGDPGVGGVTGNPQEIGLFKVGSLRNVAETAPYMHDGRFETLNRVVNHYNNGIEAHPNLSEQLRNPASGAPRRLGLNRNERDALVAFLRTLSDNNFLSEEKFSNPFPQN